MAEGQQRVWWIAAGGILTTLLVGLQVFDAMRGALTGALEIQVNSLLEKHNRDLQDLREDHDRELALQKDTFQKDIARLEMEIACFIKARMNPNPEHQLSEDFYCTKARLAKDVISR